MADRSTTSLGGSRERVVRFFRRAAKRPKVAAFMIDAAGQASARELSRWPLASTGPRIRPDMSKAPQRNRRCDRSADWPAGAEPGHYRRFWSASARRPAPDEAPRRADRCVADASNTCEVQWCEQPNRRNLIEILVASFCQQGSRPGAVKGPVGHVEWASAVVLPRRLRRRTCSAFQPGVGDGVVRFELDASGVALHGRA